MRNFIKKLLYENFRDEEIQQYIDIVDNMDKSNPRRNRYIQTLKNKYGYEYEDNNDDELINNANLNDIKNQEDFKNFNNYKKYAEKIFELRKKNIDYNKFMVYSNSSLNKKQLIDLLNKYNIKSEFNDRDISYKNIDGVNWGGKESFDKYNIIHELVHLAQDNFNIPITYSLTKYGLNNKLETEAENVTLYLLNPQYFNQIIPNIGDHIENNIPNWLVRISREIIKM